ncbi:MAG: acylphosphatase [Candidatus Eremiobacteraeota bacterium]|nr:acylphosphatase [Candidatus Eremiobacteraeota bacterium]
MKRTIVTLHGRVQAVGFRDAVQRIASRHAVAGTVRNLRDGERLEIDAEGEDDALRAFVDDVLAHPPRHARVEAVERCDAEPLGRDGFAVARTA